jgi:putative ABC transport system ATP-binding protein
MSRIDKEAPIVDLRDATKIYSMGEVEVAALRGVSLHVEVGEFVAVMGTSGSGKSTLLNLLGLLDSPTAGTYLFKGEVVTAKSDGQLARLRRHRIGFVFQFSNLFPRKTAIGNVTMPLVYAGIATRERRRRAEVILERVGLKGRTHHRPSQLSGGEHQRVAIARALVNDPAMILADEPTGNLDSATGRTVLALLQELNNEGVTIIMVTHDREIAGHAQRIVRVHDGLIVGDEPASASRDIRR